MGKLPPVHHLARLPLILARPTSTIPLCLRLILTLEYKYHSLSPCLADPPLQKMLCSIGLIGHGPTGHKIWSQRRVRLLVFRAASGCFLQPGPMLDDPGPAHILA